MKWKIGIKFYVLVLKNFLKPKKMVFKFFQYLI